jgi:hypothetical protein
MLCVCSERLKDHWAANSRGFCATNSMCWRAEADARRQSTPPRCTVKQR